MVRTLAPEYFNCFNTFILLQKNKADRNARSECIFSYTHEKTIKLGSLEKFSITAYIIISSNTRFFYVLTFFQNRFRKEHALLSRYKYAYYLHACHKAVNNRTSKKHYELIFASINPRILNCLEVLLSL
jgi:hypothetical protein